MPSKADILIVTVTKVESQAVLATFKDATGQAARTETINGRVYRHLGEINGARILLGISGMGSGGLGGSQQEIARSIESLNPAAVIMVGIAFGVDEEKQKIGDVLVSEHLRLYDLQRVGTPDVILRGSRPDASSWLLSYLRSADIDWDEEQAKIRFGLVLTGDKLVDNVDYRNQLISFEKEAIGGEMEGAGLYAACQDAKTDWILVKAICDWADGDKETDKKPRQKLAATNAAAFVLHALQHATLGDFPRSDSGEKTPTNSNTGSGGLTSHGGVAVGQGGRVVGGDYHETHIHQSHAAPGREIRSSLPHQPFFFGREKELASIAGAIAPEARTWGALIDGPGGIGKTSLAIKAAHKAPVEHFPLKLFLSAKVRELTPSGPKELTDFALREYDDLLKELARELKEESLEKLPPSERANAVRLALTNKNALLVIDNVEAFPEDERTRLYQFLALLPLGCKAIVTSRRRTDIDARVIRLTRLQESEALELIAALAEERPLLKKANAEERRHLYEVSNGNPLVLRWIAGQLGRVGSHCRTIAQACEFLESAPTNNDPLEFIFGDLLDTFTAHEIAVLAALTHFTQPAKIEWVADMTSLGDSIVQTALEDLADRALLEAADEGQMFFLPPLTAKFLRQTRPEAITETGNRLANHAYALAVTYGYENHKKFKQLEAAWPQLEAALPLLMQGNNTHLQRVCSALNKFMYFSGRWDERLSFWQEAEEKAVVVNDFLNAGWRSLQAGHIYTMRGQATAVLACAQRSAEHWEKARVDTRHKAIAISLRGSGYMLEKDYPAAQTAYEEALDINRAINSESDDVATGLNYLAQIKALQNDYDGAEYDWREGLRIAKKLNNQESITSCTSNLSGLALYRERWEDAETLAREALEMAEEIEQQEVIGWNCYCLAKTLTRQGKTNGGLPYALRAVEIYTNLRHHNLEIAQAVLKECGG